MSNNVYNQLVREFAALFGTGEPLPSGRGFRFRSRGRGKVTVYMANLAPGNLAEAAFEPESFAGHAGVTRQQAHTLLRRLQLVTGRQVQPNPRYNWPRIGLSTVQHVEQVVAQLRQTLVPPSL